MKLQKILCVLSGLGLLVAAFGMSGCGEEDEDNENNNGGTNHAYTVSGEVAPHSDETAYLEISSAFDSVGEGEINENGAFTFTFFDIRQLDYFDRVMNDVDDYFEPFSDCRMSDLNVSDPDFRFFTARNISVRTIDDDEHGTTRNDGTLSYSSTPISPDSPAENDYTRIRVYFVYVDRAVDIDGACNMRDTHPDNISEVDLSLQPGWNEVVGTWVDGSESHHRHWETKTIPSDIEWYESWD